MRIRGIRNVNFSEKIANVLKNDSRTYVQEIEISTSSERESRFFLCSKQMDDKECGVALLFLLFTLIFIFIDLVDFLKMTCL